MNNAMYDAIWWCVTGSMMKGNLNMLSGRNFSFNCCSSVKLTVIGGSVFFVINDGDVILLYLAYEFAILLDILP